MKTVQKILLLITLILYNQLLNSALNFNKTAFSGSGVSSLYLGSKEEITDDTLKAFAITSINSDQSSIDIKGITPEKVIWYTEEKAKEEQDNDLYGKQILNLAPYQNSYLIATYEQKGEGETESTSNVLYLILNPQQDGKFTIKTRVDADANPLKDAYEPGTDEEPRDTKQIKAVVGSDSYIFAAVSANEAKWEDNTSAGENRGIAIVNPSLSASPNATITQLAADDLTNSAAKAFAAKISNKPRDQQICFSEGSDTDKIGQANIGSLDKPTNVDMCWSSSLQRLYVGLSEIKRDDPSKEGGCFSILVGRTEINTTDKKTKFVISPILSNPQKDRFYVNTTKHIMSFYYDKTDSKAIKISAKKVRSMLTSTSKNYLIANCVVAEDSTNHYNLVFALPVLGFVDNNGKKIPDAQVGTLSQINSATRLPSFNAIPGKTEMPVFIKNDIPKSTKGILVGGEVPNDVDLSDMFIYGDSVYMCISDKTNAQDQGIFQSSAIFNENGVIVAWTPWQRVGGDIYRVLGGGVDSLANFYFLCGDKSDPDLANTVKITRWGKSEDTKPVFSIPPTDEITATDGNLSSVLSGIFPQEQGGVFQVINFDEQTDGFKKSNFFSMMVAVGYDKVALIQTGKREDGKFKPVKKFVVNDNVFVFDLSDLNIGPLCFAELSRNTETGKGWIFVGGYDGVAVLCDKDGKGWDAAAGLDNLTQANFPGAGYSFKKITPNNGDFKYVRKLASLVSQDLTDNKLFIQTMTKLYAIDQDAAKFKTGSVEAKEITFSPALETPHFTDMLIIPNSDEQASTLSNAFKFILGTTHGLFYASGYDGTKLTLKAVNYPTNPALHLHYLSGTKGKNGTLGNLFVTYANFLTNSGKVYRYAVDGSNATPVKSINMDNTNLFIDFHGFRGNFVTDNAFGFSMLTKGPLNPIMTHIYKITENATTTSVPLDEYLDLACSNWYVGVITRNTASGSWLVPGDWGIRLNE
jgi:hypothetical protein